jgi:LuxR family maltose regulon positive regulatory protein
LALLASTSGSLGYERSAAFAIEAMRNLPTAHVVVPYAQVVAGWMHLLGGSWDIGIHELRRAVHLAHSSGVWSTEVEAKALLAVALLSRGDYLAAEPLVRDALSAFEQGSMGHFVASGALVAGPAALVAARAGQHGLAAVQLARVRESVTMFGPILPWLGSTHEACAAAAYALLGDQYQAGLHLSSATDATEGQPTSRLLTDLLEVARTTVEGEFHLSHLSPAERRVFERLLTRATLREIAESLFVSPETVKSQAGSIYRKLGVSSRRDLQDLGDRLRLT